MMRSSELNPDVLVWDPDRPRARGRRVVTLQVPAYIVGGAIAGYLLDGLSEAVYMGACAAFGAWWYLRRERDR